MVPTDRIGNAITEALRMQHMIFRIEHIVTHKLHRFSIHDRQMFVLHHRISEMLMDEFTKGSPFIAIMHDQEVVTFCNEIVRDE